MPFALMETCDSMREFSSAVSMDDVHGVLLNRCARHGVTNVLAGVVPQPDMPPGQEPEHIMLGHWPQAWTERYIQKGYIRCDPTIIHCANSSGEALWWSDIVYGDNETARRM